MGVLGKVSVPAACRLSSPAVIVVSVMLLVSRIAPKPTLSESVPKSLPMLVRTTSPMLLVSNVAALATRVKPAYCKIAAPKVVTDRLLALTSPSVRGPTFTQLTLPELAGSCRGLIVRVPTLLPTLFSVMLAAPAVKVALGAVMAVPPAWVSCPLTRFRLLLAATLPRIKAPGLVTETAPPVAVRLLNELLALFRVTLLMPAFTTKPPGDVSAPACVTAPFAFSVTGPLVELTGPKRRVEAEERVTAPGAIKLAAPSAARLR